ncbi:HEPN domain-containing protein [Desulfoplanes sp.]
MNEEIVTEWLKSAQLDLASIHYLIDKEHLTPIVAFHAQQTIEKTIKGLLESKNLRVPKTINSSHSSRWLMLISNSITIC